MTTRPQIKINTAPQLDIFSSVASNSDHKNQDEYTKESSEKDKRRFDAPSPDAITLGSTSLKEHLQLSSQKTPFTIRFTRSPSLRPISLSQILILTYPFQ